eukprot:14666110-Heterocapsa_arctica.AAC.1
MELVVWLERNIKAPDYAVMIENKKEEEKMVSAKIFYKAVNMLKEVGEDQVRENQGEATNTR